MKKICQINASKKTKSSKSFTIMKPAIEKGRLRIGICQDQPC